MYIKENIEIKLVCMGIGKCCVWKLVCIQCIQEFSKIKTTTTKNGLIYVYIGYSELPTKTIREEQIANLVQFQQRLLKNKNIFETFSSL